MSETQMTFETSQTTAERLLAIIGMNYRIIVHGDARIADHSKAAEIIAAEIDAKDKRIAELEGLLREHEDATRDAVAVTLAGNALAGELAKALAEVERLRPRPVDDGATGVPNGPVLAWDGFHWHRAEYFRYRAVESFFDDESVFEDIDDEGIAWMREGWYESIGSLLPDYDSQWFKIEQPVTHWMPLPKDGPAATREAHS